MNDDIKVFKPERRFKLPQLTMPKVGPKMLMAATVTLALLAVVTAGLLTRKQSTKQFVPQLTAAATTATISDNFNGASIDLAKWTLVTNAPGSVITQSGGNLVINIPIQSSNDYASARYINQITGDFLMEVDLLTPSGSDTAGTEIFFSNLTGTGVQGHQARISRIKVTSGERVDSDFSGTNFASVSIPAGTTNVRGRIIRIGNSLQTFYNFGSGFILLGSITTGYSGNGTIELVSFVTAPNFPANISNFDNFTAQVNLVGAPTPGTPAACTTQFTVLALAPTPTPTPLSSPTPTPLGASPTPTPTPTPSPTPFPAPTPTPTPSPITGCNFACVTNTDCPSTMICYQGACRNPSCVTAASCVCGGAATPTPAPSPTAPVGTSTPTPAPLTKLTQAGSVLGTWTVSVVGIIMVAFGALMLAF